MTIKIAPDFFEVDLRLPEAPDDPDLRRAINWLASFMPADEWKQRRFGALERFINAATGNLAIDPSGIGRFFSVEDQFAWYLFLGQASLDHPLVYDFMFGSRVVPILRAIGRNLELLKNVEGIAQRVQRLVGTERGQPNGGLFELLVAAAYLREGAEVRFVPEAPGVKKTHDLDVRIHGQDWAIECKRMELGEYTERERARMRELWLPVARELQKKGLNVLAQVQFSSEIGDIPPDYLAYHAARWMSGGFLLSHKWQDQYGSGAIGTLNMGKLTAVLETDDVALHSSRMIELLTGRYKRNAKIIQLLDVRMGANPLYVTECRQAILLDWESLSSTAIDRKARDVLKQLANGTNQLPDDRPGVVHIGLEAVDGNEVETRRYEKVQKTVASFDSKGKPLEYIYINWFAPESPPNEFGAFDETYHWSGKRPEHSRPLRDGMLVLGSDVDTRPGVHWDGMNRAN